MPRCPRHVACCPQPHAEHSRASPGANRGAGPCAPLCLEGVPPQGPRLALHVAPPQPHPPPHQQALSSRPSGCPVVSGAQGQVPAQSCESCGLRKVRVSSQCPEDSVDGYTA